MIYSLAREELAFGACMQDPERWTTTADDGARAICRECPRRWACAREACESPGAEGLWAGIVVPGSGRGRAFALQQLKSLADRHGYPVRVRSPECGCISPTPDYDVIRPKERSTAAGVRRTHNEWPIEAVKS
jgi:WhiB family redox-sensing transcriptional regulator